MDYTPEIEGPPVSPEPFGVLVVGDTESAQPYVRAVERLSHVRLVGQVESPEMLRSSLSRLASELRPSQPTTPIDWNDVDAVIHAGPLTLDSESMAMIGNTGTPIFSDICAGRYRAEAQTIRASIESGEIGSVVFDRFALGTDSTDVATGPTSMELSAWQQRTQALDLLGWWIGDVPDTVYAQRTESIESITVRYVGGATAVCDIVIGGPSYREIVVVGTDAAISMSWSDHVDVLLSASGSRTQYLGGSPWLDAALDSWIEDVRSERTPLVVASDLAVAVAVENGVEQSLASRQPASVKSTRSEGRDR